jgi:hypothetical protein
MVLQQLLAPEVRGPVLELAPELGNHLTLDVVEELSGIEHCSKVVLKHDCIALEGPEKLEEGLHDTHDTANAMLELD